MTLPGDVESITSQYLELIDKALPEQVVGLYLTGSLPLGDYRPGRSDVDGVVVVAEPPKDVEAVREVHAQLPPKPAFDVTYLNRLRPRLAARSSSAGGVLAGWRLQGRAERWPGKPGAVVGAGAPAAGCP
jgi:hypothetical protein